MNQTHDDTHSTGRPRPNRELVIVLCANAVASIAALLHGVFATSTIPMFRLICFYALLIGPGTTLFFVKQPRGQKPLGPLEAPLLTLAIGIGMYATFAFVMNLFAASTLPSIAAYLALVLSLQFYLLLATRREGQNQSRVGRAGLSAALLVAIIVLGTRAADWIMNNKGMDFVGDTWFHLANIMKIARGPISTESAYWPGALNLTAYLFNTIHAILGSYMALVHGHVSTIWEDHRRVSVILHILLWTALINRLFRQRLFTALFSLVLFAGLYASTREAFPQFLRYSVPNSDWYFFMFPMLLLVLSHAIKRQGIPRLLLLSSFALAFCASHMMALAYAAMFVPCLVWILLVTGKTNRRLAETKKILLVMLLGMIPVVVFMLCHMSAVDADVASGMPLTQLIKGPGCENVRLSFVSPSYAVGDVIWPALPHASPMLLGLLLIIPWLRRTFLAPCLAATALLMVVFFYFPLCFTELIRHVTMALVQRYYLIFPVPWAALLYCIATVGFFALLFHLLTRTTSKAALSATITVAAGLILGCIWRWSTPSGWDGFLPTEDSRVVYASVLGVILLLGVPLFLKAQAAGSLPRIRFRGKAATFPILAAFVFLAAAWRHFPPSTKPEPTACTRWPIDINARTGRTYLEEYFASKHLSGKRVAVMMLDPGLAKVVPALTGGQYSYCDPTFDYGAFPETPEQWRAACTTLENPSSSIAETMAILRERKIDYIITPSFLSATYNDFNWKTKIDYYPKSFQLAFRSNNMALYRVLPQEAGAALDPGVLPVRSTPFYPSDHEIGRVGDYDILRVELYSPQNVRPGSVVKFAIYARVRKSQTKLMIVRFETDSGIRLSGVCTPFGGRLELVPNKGVGSYIRLEAEFTIPESWSGRGIKKASLVFPDIVLADGQEVSAELARYTFENSN